MDIRIRIGSILNGAMVYWEKIEDAARYYVKLYIEEKEAYFNKTVFEQELETVEIDRNKFYHTFQGLAKFYKQGMGFKYFIEVLAENRDGQIIARSQKAEAAIDDSLSVYGNSHFVH